jgi:mono/diheme cytochrome c family protein
MKTYLKWAGISLLSFLVVAVGLVYGATELRFRKAYASPERTVVVSSDPETIARGRHIAVTRGCVDCHGDDLGGRVFLDMPILANLYASNLTSGAGGVAATYGDGDFERAIRHGIAPGGRALLFMPSHEYYPLSDEDLAALISYIRSLAPVDVEPPRNRVGPLGRFLVATRQIPYFVPAEAIAHDAPRPSAPAAGVTAEYGGYLATGCTGCHGDRFSGGRIPGAPPEFIPVANITPHQTGIGDWDENDFFRAMREGRRPDGSMLHEQMPWQALGTLTDDELSALWLYLRSLPPLEYGNR